MLGLSNHCWASQRLTMVTFAVNLRLIVQSKPTGHKTIKEL